MIARFLLHALLAIVLLVAAGDALALRCGSRLVDTGDYDFQVRERCGEPYWISDDSALLITGAYGPVVQRAVQQVQDWYYNFGPGTLVQRLVFVDGRLQRIDTLGYGRASIGNDCGDIAFLRGTREGELVLRCGPPAARTLRYRDSAYYTPYGYAYTQPSRYEEWRYPKPDSRDTRLVIMVEGRIERVEDVDTD